MTQLSSHPRQNPSSYALETAQAHFDTHFSDLSESDCKCRPAIYAIPKAIDQLEEIKTWGVPGFDYTLSTDPQFPDKIAVFMEAYVPHNRLDKHAFQRFSMSAEAISQMKPTEILVAFAVRAGLKKAQARIEDQKNDELANLRLSYEAQVTELQQQLERAETRANRQQDQINQLVRRLEALKQREREQKQQERERKEQEGKYKFPECGDGKITLGRVIAAFQQATSDVGEPDIRWTRDGIDRVLMQNKRLASALFQREIGQKVSTGWGRHGYRIYFSKPMFDRAVEILRNARE